MTQKKRMETVAKIINRLVLSDMMNGFLIQMNILEICDAIMHGKNVHAHPMDYAHPQVIVEGASGFLTKSEADAISKKNMSDEFIFRFGEMMTFIAQMFVDENRETYSESIATALKDIMMGKNALFRKYIPQMKTVTIDEAKEFLKNCKKIY